MRLAKVLLFDRQLLDDSSDTDESVFAEITIKVDDVKEFEEEMVKAA